MFCCLLEKVAKDVSVIRLQKHPGSKMGLNMADALLGDYMKA